MTASLPEPTELQPPPRSGGRGLMDAALPAPAGWERGLAVPWYSCGEPILRDKCIAGVDEAHRPDVAEYPSFPIEQGSTCSTLSGLDHEAHARGRLDATTEWALGRQLATDQVGTGAPSLADAQVLGTLAGPEDVVWAVACLEQAAADTGYGSPWVLHTSPRGAAYARRYKMMDSEGLSPNGMPWIVSPGYPSVGDGAAEDTVRFWVTGPVWAAVDTPQVNAAVDWRQNEDTAYALRAGIVAFDPCINFAYDVTVGACGEVNPPDTNPRITSPEDGATVNPFTPFRGRGCGPNQAVELWVRGANGTEHHVDDAVTDANGSFRFIGTEGISPGTSTWWVVCGGETSPEVTVTVPDDTPTEPLSFDWELRSSVSTFSWDLSVRYVPSSGTLPGGLYTVVESSGDLGWTDQQAPNDMTTEAFVMAKGTGAVEGAGLVSVSVEGPYGVRIDASGTGSSTDSSTVLDSGTVTYTRPARTTT